MTSWVPYARAARQSLLRASALSPRPPPNLPITVSFFTRLHSRQSARTPFIACFVPSSNNPAEQTGTTSHAHIDETDDLRIDLEQKFFVFPLDHREHEAQLQGCTFQSHLASINKSISSAMKLSIGNFLNSRRNRIHKRICLQQSERQPDLRRELNVITQRFYSSYLLPTTCEVCRSQGIRSCWSCTMPIVFAFA